MTRKTTIYRLSTKIVLALWLLCSWIGPTQQVQAQSSGFNFSSSGLQGVTLTNPTSLQFGPDGRLYVSQQNGIIKAFTIARTAANYYNVTATETINLINQIPNHNDDGTLAANVTSRQVTGLLVTGTASAPILYVSSSDSRIGGPDGDKNLDTNSGTISRLTKSGSSWTKVDLVRGLPRSEENHAVNGLELDPASNTLFVAVGGSTNAGAPSTNFAYLTEYALSAAILSINLTAIDQLPTKGSGNLAYKYDLPTVDDPTRPNNADGTDVNDPFGGNDGLNQAKIVAGGPVQVYSPGYRNPYDLVITRTPGKAGRMYTIDNGANQGWGGHPAQEGPGGTATNNYVTGEPGSTGPGPNDPQVNNLDNLHYIGNVATYVPGSHYGGHPTPIRANPNGAGLYTFSGGAGVWRTSKTGVNPLPADWPPVPASMANPVEGDFQQPGKNDDALLTFTASTNGLAEYRASNFNNALKGTLLAAGYNGEIYKILPTADGTGVTNKLATWSTSKVNDEVDFASGFGSQPLDITTQGDNDIFPGTVWAATYGNHAITIFEPQDFVVCTGNYSLTLDEDGDGYSNADEIDNLTDPCSASSKPKDFDQDLLSDANDPDDDNDGLPDNTDYFALDAANGLATSLPVRYELFNNDPGTGLFGLGFTGLMSNGSNDYDNQYEESNLIAGGAVGAFSVVDVSLGDALGSLNSQQNAFQFGVNVQAATGPFTVQGRIVGPFFNNTIPQNSQSQGIYIGTGDQDNYLKVVFNANNGAGGIEVVYEQNGVATRNQFPVTGALTSSTIDLYLSVNPVTGQVQPKYALEGGSAVSLGSPIALGGTLLTSLQSSPALAVGLIATSRGASMFTATWDFIRITADPATALGDWQPVIPTAGSPSARHENAYVQAGDKFYLIGGRGTKAVNAFDPVAKTWTNKAATPLELHHFQAVSLNGLIYVAGAFTGAYPHETPVANVYIYNPLTDKWVLGPAIPEARRRGSAGVVARNNKIYLIGGILDGHWTGHVPWLDEYDPATNTWKALADAPRARDHFQAAVLDGKIYVAGGRRTSGITGQTFQLTVPETDIYDFASGTWTSLPATGNIPTKRAGTASAVLGDELLIIGGESSQATAHKETEALNIHTNTWRRLADLDQGRHASQAIVNNNGVYIAAGSGNQGGGPELTSQEAFFMFAPAAPVVSAITQSSLTAPASLSFGTVALGNTKSEVITLSNTGSSQAIVISALSISGATVYAATSPYPLPLVIQPRESVNISLSFSPTAGGTQAANLAVVHSGLGGSTTVALSGAGQGEGLSASPGSLHFFSQQAGITSAPQAITLTNNGSASLSITSVSISGANSAEFAHSGNGTITLASGASSTLNVTFTPSSLGTKVAQLNLVHSGGNSPLTLGLTGEGLENPNPVPTQALYRINAGGGMLGTSRGSFAADNYFAPSPGYTFSNTGSMAGTEDDALYQTERSSASDNGSFSYALPAANGTYTVVLHFAELYWSGSGQRKFDVTLENNLVLDNYDIIAKTGGKQTAITETFTVNVADGTLDLFFDAAASVGGVNRPKISAIEVLAQSSGNTPPLANAGIDQSLTLPANSVLLSGSGSDADGSIASYSWTQQSGPAATLSGTTTATLAASSLVAGTYVFRLTVTDNGGATGFDEVTVLVNGSLPSNTAPLANAGADQSLTLPANSVLLSGSGSDADGSIASYSWTQQSGPAATLSGANTATLGASSLLAGTYVFRLTVTDNGGATGFDEVTVIVNNAPVAGQSLLSFTLVNASTEQDIMTLATGETLNLATLPTKNLNIRANTQPVTVGSVKFALTGPQNKSVTESGAPYALYGDNNGNYNSWTPALGSYVLSATPYTGSGGGGTAGNPLTVSFTVVNQEIVNLIPTANAGADQVITLPVNSVALNGSGNDPDGSIASYSWTKQSGPAATLSGANTATLGASSLLAGTYVFRLTVTDNGGATGYDEVTLVVNHDPNVNQPPVANAGADQTLTLPANSLTLAGSGSDSDGQVVSFNWTQQSGPAATLSGVNTANLGLANLVAGSYVFRLTLADEDGATGYDEVAVMVNPLVVGQQVVSFSLMSASTNQEILTLSPGATINLANWPGTGLNIRANTNPEIVGSVKLSLKGAQNKSVTESGAPYALFGDTNGNYYSWTPALGSYTLTGTPYSRSGASGTEGIPLTISFTVVNQPLTAPLARLDLSGMAGAGEATAGISAYPNPFGETLQLRIEAAKAEPYLVRVYDQVGRLQLQEQVRPVSAGTLLHPLAFSKGGQRPAGIYFVVVENEGGQIRKVLKVVKDR